MYFVLSCFHRFSVQGFNKVLISCVFYDISQNVLEEFGGTPKNWNFLQLKEH